MTMPCASVNYNREEPRLTPTMSLRAGAQVGVQGPEGAFMGGCRGCDSGRELVRDREPKILAIKFFDKIT